MTKQEFKDKLLRLKVHSMLWVIPVWEFHATGYRPHPKLVIRNLKVYDSRLRERTFSTQTYTNKKNGKSVYIIFRNE